MLSVISSYAYDYALRGNEAHGRRAVAALRNYLGTVMYPPGDCNNTGQTVFTIGAVYDWCYPLLTADDRTALIDAGLATAAKMEISPDAGRAMDRPGTAPLKPRASTRDSLAQA